MRPGELQIKLNHNNLNKGGGALKKVRFILFSTFIIFQQALYLLKKKILRKIILFYPIEISFPNGAV